MKKIIFFILEILILFLLVSCKNVNSDQKLSSAEESASLGDLKGYEKNDIVFLPQVGVQIIKNRLIICLDKPDSEAEIQSILTETNCKIIGKLDFLLQVETLQNVTIEELKEIKQKFNQSSAVLIATYDVVYESLYQSPNDPYDSSKDNLILWDEVYPAQSNWGLEAVHAISTWQIIDVQKKPNIGIVDFGFDIKHEDLVIPASNANGFQGNILGNSEHGTSVASIIGATHNNEKGLSGIAPNADLHVYQASTVGEIFKAIKWHLKFEKSKVINLSIGYDYLDAINNGVSQDELSLLIAESREMCEKFILELQTNTDPSYNDFLIVQAAGNDKVNAENNLLFATVESPSARAHVIIVGGIGLSTEIPGQFEMYDMSNRGTKVDIVAPAVDIYVAKNNNKYYIDSGTSFATPFVTGTVGLMIANAPNLKCTEIRKLLMDACSEKIYDNEYSYPILDTFASVKAAVAKSTGTVHQVSDTDLIKEILNQVYGARKLLFQTCYNKSDSHLDKYGVTGITFKDQTDYRTQFGLYFSNKFIDDFEKFRDVSSGYESFYCFSEASFGLEDLSDLVVKIENKQAFVDTSTYLFPDVLDPMNKYDVRFTLFKDDKTGRWLIEQIDYYQDGLFQFNFIMQSEFFSPQDGEMDIPLDMP